MVQFDQEESSQCVVYDLTPESEQKKINIIIRPSYTVSKVFSDISTQYHYDRFDLILQPVQMNKDLVYLNDCKDALIYQVLGFQPSTRNVLLLMPTGKWEGDVRKRYSFPLSLLKSSNSINGATPNAHVNNNNSKNKNNSTININSNSNGNCNINSDSTEICVGNGNSNENEKPKPKLKAKVKTKVKGKEKEKDKEKEKVIGKEKEQKIERGKESEKKMEMEKLKGIGSNNNSVALNNSLNSVHHNESINNGVGAIRIGGINIDLGVSITGNPYTPLTPIEPDTTILNDVMLAHEIPTPPPGSTTDSLNLSPMSDPEPLSDDDLALGASASPTETEPIIGEMASLPHTSPNGSRSKFGTISDDAFYQHIFTRVQSSECEDDGDLRPSSEKCRKTARVAALSLPTTSSSSTSFRNGGYVGLVNQAMTCYLNSLLQALFMTPEFRNALYRWEFDNDNESKNIPYQLQKLFLNLQTSKKSAVETTFLTRSFGWDSTEAWQQHDIQELCRVMFDALEHKFRNTKQANLISTLYEGKMIDYVKCLECHTEKARIDTFLDIPLPVRPFGSSVAYGSIEEALRAFVQPETLDENNQYFCEKCNKKCDAHKGLKFKTFPYILTLHLKRFDFDYQTMHRIKLNDKVTFPQMLNLNSFVDISDCQNGAAQGQLNSTTAPTDDCSTTDSGSAMEEDNCSSGVVTTASSSQHENDMIDEDEGIDMSINTDQRTNSSENAEQNIKQESGPYLYELFAIMIHSGSASGGHYYAYIKEFENNNWFCFNDQSVTSITEEDIERSFGGSSTKGYYSSAYTSSTNAYMLMYRQIDRQRNEFVMKSDDFPNHINSLLPKLNVEDELRSSRISRYGGFTDLALHTELIKPRVYFYNPELKKLKVTRVYVSRNFDVNTILESAYSILNVEKFAPISRCRLVDYDATSEEIVQSFEKVSDPSLSEIRAANDGTLDFLLEYRAEGQVFEIYTPGGATWNVFVVNLATMEMDGPYLVYSSAHDYSDELRRAIAIRLHVNESEMLLATLPNKKAFVAYDPKPTKEAEKRLQAISKTKFRSLTYFYMYVPKTDPCYLEIMGIPAYEPSSPQKVTTNSSIENGCSGDDVVDAVLMNGCTSSTHSVQSITDLTSGCLSANSSDSRRESPLPPHGISVMGATGQESNSEDSSLSDGDRTLVESMPNRGGDGGGGNSQISSSSSTHSPQLSSPEEEAKQESYSRITAFLNRSSHTSDTADSTLLSHHASIATPFFHAIELKSFDGIFETSRDNLATTASSSSSDDEMSRKHAYKIIVDSHMKMEVFQRHIASLIRVPANYFTIQRKHGTTETVGSDQLLVFFSESETLLVELGKALLPNEQKSKIFFMRLSDLDNETGRLPCICEWIYNTNMTVAEAKKDLIAKLHRIDTKYQTLTMANCRLWLKGGRNPIKIMRDDESLANDVRTSVAVDFLVQECDEGIDPQPNEDSTTLFVRQWHADTLQLDKFQEITLEKDSEMQNVLSKLSGIPEEHIAYCKINSAFPCTTISLLSVNTSLSWFSIAATMNKYPLNTTINGNVYFYKDATKPPKELSTDERRDWSVKEKSRLDQLGCVSTSLYSPRRERALKIYVDSPSPAAQMDTTISSYSINSAPADSSY